MGQTNLLSGLKSKYAKLSGEVEALDVKINKLKADYASLPEFEERLGKLREGVVHLSAVIRMDDESWDEATAKPVKPYTRQLPMKPGACSATALDILRLAERWMTAREISLQVLAHHGIKEPESKLIQRTTNTVDATLRAHKGKTIVCDDAWPRRWRSDRGLILGR